MSTSPVSSDSDPSVLKSMRSSTILPSTILNEVRMSARIGS
jgi:hypothetical protein